MGLEPTSDEINKLFDALSAQLDHVAKAEIKDMSSLNQFRDSMTVFSDRHKKILDDYYDVFGAIAQKSGRGNYGSARARLNALFSRENTDKSWYNIAFTSIRGDDNIKRMRRKEMLDDAVDKITPRMFVAFLLGGLLTSSVVAFGLDHWAINWAAIALVAPVVLFFSAACVVMPVIFCLKISSAAWLFISDWRYARTERNSRI